MTGVKSSLQLFFRLFGPGFFLLFGIGLPTVQAQIPVTGIVLDGRSDQPIEGANVFIDEAKAYTLTDEKGNFALEVPEPGKYHLHVTYLGYEILHWDVKAGPEGVSNLKFRLETGSVHLDTVLVESDFLSHGARENSLNVEVADKAFLEENLGNSFANTLEKIPGITSLNTGVGVAKPVVRGLTFNRVMVNENGIKQEGQQWGADHGLEMDAFRVERVEVVKGPGSLLYGSDGMGGVINIKAPPVPEEGSFGGEVLGIHRSNNASHGLSAALKGNRKNNFFRARYSGQFFGDYKVPAETFTYLGFVLPIFNQQLKNTAGREHNFSGEVGTIRNWGTLRVSGSSYFLRAGFFPGAIGIPRFYQLTPDGSTRNIDLPYQQVHHLKLLVNSKIFLKEDHTLEIDAGIQRNDRQEHSNAHSHGKGPASDTSLALKLDLRTLTLNSRYRIRHSARFRSVFGMQLQAQENLREGFEFLIPGFRTFGSGVFAFGEYELSETATLNGGLRADLGLVSADQYLEAIYVSEDSISGYWERTPAVERRFLSWSGAAGLSWYPKESINFKFNLGRSFRYPSAPELSENGVHHGTFRHEKGDPTLNPEVGYQLDLGLSYEKRDLLLKFTPYFNYFENYIFLRPSGSFSTLPDAGQIYQYTESSALHTGMEALAEWHPLETFHLSATGEYVWNYNLNTFLPLPFTPPFILMTQADYTFKDVGKVLREPTLGAEFQYFGAQNRTDRNEAATPAYQLVHLTANAKIYAGKQPFYLYFRVTNLFNTSYLNHLSRYRILNLPEQGRNFVITLKVPFGTEDH